MSPNAARFGPYAPSSPTPSYGAQPWEGWRNSGSSGGSSSNSSSGGSRGRGSGTSGNNSTPGQNARRVSNLRRARGNTAPVPHGPTRGSTAGSRNLPGANARRANNLRNARAAQNPVTAPRPSTTGAPTAPVPRGIPAAGAGATGGAAATASIWTATPASAPLATAITVPLALGAGLAVGNAIYEDVLGRPFGPSLGDLFFPREEPQRDGARDPYSAPGLPTILEGPSVGVLYGISVDIRRIDGNTSNRRTAVFGPIWRIYVVPGDNEPWIEYGPSHAKGRVDSSSPQVPPVAEILNVRITRLDGLVDTPVIIPGTPQPAPPSQPYRPPQPFPLPNPNPDPFPRPDAPPLAEPQPEPDPQPTSQPAPYPNSRPDESPLPFPPLIPARAPTPTATPTPTPSTPSGPSAPPPSGRQGNRCPCSSVVIGNVGQQLNPISQAQEAIRNNTILSAGADAAILARLAQMQTFAEKAWKNTKLDKLINLLTLISVLHNAAMLSRNVGETIGELASNMLATVGVKDATGSQLDINELVGTSVRRFVQSVVGVEVYTDVSTAWKKSSRIVSSAANIVYTVRGLHDTSKDVMEWTAENTGKIGNALKRWGVVGERAYPWMSERVKAQDAYRRKFERVTQGLEGLEDTASSLSQVTSNTREIQEEYTELKQQKDAFTALISTTPPATVPTAAPESAPIATAETTAANDSQSANVAIADAQKGTTP
jgi:hypothetical protein